MKAPAWLLALYNRLANALARVAPGARGENRDDQ